MSQCRSPGSTQLAMRLSEQIFAEAERFFERARDADRACGGDSHDGAQRQRRNAEAGFTKNDAVEPWPANRMFRDILAKRVDQDIDVRQDHLKCFMRSIYSRSSNSCSSEKLRPPMPGIGPPVAVLMRGRHALGFRQPCAVGHNKPQPVLDQRCQRAAFGRRLALGAAEQFVEAI